MWFLVLGGHTPYPTSIDEPLEFTMSLKQGVVRSAESPGPAQVVRAFRAIDGGIFSYHMVAGFPDFVKPSDVILPECLIRLRQRSGGLHFGSFTAVAVLWPVVVDGQEWLVFPPWLSESLDPQLLPAHLLSPSRSGGIGKVLRFGNLGTRPYRAAGGPGMPLTGSLAAAVDFAQHANIDADVFAPTDTQRVLMVGRPPLTVEVSPPPPVEVPSAPDAATKADLRAIEQRLFVLQNGLANVAEALGNMATYSDVLLSRQQARADAATVNGSIAAVGDHMVKVVPERKQRILETAGVSLLTSAIAGAIAK